MGISLFARLVLYLTKWLNKLAKQSCQYYVTLEISGADALLAREI